MTYDTLQKVLWFEREFKYDAGDGTGNDDSVDASAKSVNVNSYLATDIGKNSIVTILAVVALLLGIILLYKNLKK